MGAQPGAPWRRWSDEEIADLKRWLAEGVGLAEIGARLDRSAKAVHEKASVRGFESDVVLDAEGGTVVQRWQPGPQHLTLTFRFMLAPGLVPGTYPWPLRLTVRPLEST